MFLDNFVPDERVDSIYDIDLQRLKKEGIRGIITDLDNTLVGARDPLATPELLEWLTHVRDIGLAVVIVSNNNRLRVSAFAEPIPLPYIHAARKPVGRSFRQALGLLGVQPHEAVMLGDQLLTDVFGGKRIGLRTILVTPISPKHEGVFTRFNRRVEKIIYRRLDRRRGTSREGQ